MPALGERGGSEGGDGSLPTVAEGEDDVAGAGADAAGASEVSASMLGSAALGTGGDADAAWERDGGWSVASVVGKKWTLARGRE